MKGCGEVGKAATKAKNKYNAANYDRIALNVPKGIKDIVKQHADMFDNGSVNAFINRAIEETMARDKKEGLK